jgi:hypothetical protein
MFLKDRSGIILDTQEQTMNLLYVTPIELHNGFFLPGPIELTMAILPKKDVSYFDRYTFLVGYGRFVTKPCVDQNIGICVDFGEYDIKRR